jgi:hypothetical protein
MTPTFGKLIERYGVPWLVMPDTPHVQDNTGNQGIHQRTPLSTDAYWLITAQLEVPLEALNTLETRLRHDSISLLEYRRTGDLVRLSLETDAIPVRREGMHRVVQQRQVLSVQAGRSPTDNHVHFIIATPDLLESTGAYHFFFPTCPGLTDQEVPASGPLNPWKSVDDFFTAFKVLFTRDDLIQQHTARPRPSATLSARIQGWIDELPADGLQNWLRRACKEHNALPLHATLIDLWAIQPDGTVLCMDHEAFNHPTEPETDPVTIFAATAQGARTYPELSALILHRPSGVRLCQSCGGVGWTKTEQTPITCVLCGGLGWYVRGARR